MCVFQNWSDQSIDSGGIWGVCEINEYEGTFLVLVSDLKRVFMHDLYSRNASSVHWSLEITYITFLAHVKFKLNWLLLFKWQDPETPSFKYP